ncbi:MAG: hypothetical protein UU88_C0007G0017 [Parcubacteria group bacterium GW2011_GWC1_42_11]|uniref:Uncharacterized protein n=1 Tax=Candidatus Nomurabacteria bacterium GW2011_GWC2_42_20 TaxID=1618756 RepID=A0A0G0ZFI3_9BACT|nr:MAG: hypothetical protein UU88_C0007G0017 [Parcubacteria group bacterium GW2011_GWC1_42_11]KKS47477.1 MAG: hypothetical protein UV12_C0007G0017 [Candidatus Nomurabacteria bacterium GW2011_GWC2_42_20]KKS59144.1 MAG: hypothetical protein UV24_C0006G0014 [Candidatus Nomurabacteria bacterium GW2011_GWA2_42_41]KKT09502.1 MAG: hypothetical protein UV86_C0006G0017 [Candidatus Nomurabacteria bacterium GW2011_GWB1_43_20]HBH71346.1 hypothetical protein [Candidatus Yonathbacteria bacterium]
MNKPFTVWNLIWGAIALAVILFSVSDNSTDWNQIIPIVAPLIIVYFFIDKKLNRIENKIETLPKKISVL